MVATCPPGRFGLKAATSASETKCSVCPAGTYSSGFGSGRCTACNAGTYSNVTGASLCQACPPGTYSNVTGSTVCTPFANGTTNSAQPEYYMTVSGHKYTLMSTLVPSLVTASGAGPCQNGYYISLPYGWVVAQSNCHSLFALSCPAYNAFVNTCYETVFADNTLFHAAAAYSTDAVLTNENGQYSVEGAGATILITDDINAVAAPCLYDPRWGRDLSSCSLCGVGNYSVNGAIPCKNRWRIRKA